MKKKYKLMDDCKVVDGITVFRIEAMIRFSDVEPGESGGFVEGENNLSHAGDAWVYNDAVVCGQAQVIDSAMVGGNAVVKDRVVVCDHSYVGRDMKINGDIKVCDDVWLASDFSLGGRVVIGGNLQIPTKTIAPGSDGTTFAIVESVLPHIKGGTVLDITQTCESDDVRRELRAHKIRCVVSEVLNALMWAGGLLGAAYIITGESIL